MTIIQTDLTYGRTKKQAKAAKAKSARARRINRLLTNIPTKPNKRDRAIEALQRQGERMEANAQKKRAKIKAEVDRVEQRIKDAEAKAKQPLSKKAIC